MPGFLAENSMNEIISKTEGSALDTSDRPWARQRSEMQQTLDMIERIILDKDLDLSRVEKMLDLRDRIEAREAKKAFNASLARAQPRLPVIGRSGEIIIRNKDDRAKGLPVEKQRIEQKTKFADWADINEAITPIIAEEGLSLGFDSVGGKDSSISVTCYLRHSGGHEQQTTLVLPHDSSGSKNPVQAIGSSLSYGKRYTAGLLLNFVSRAAPERDDDGKSSDEKPQTVGEEKAKELEQALADCGGDLALFKGHFDIKELAELPTGRLEEAQGMIAGKAAKKAKAEAAKAAKSDAGK
jgi:hypothetical protein